jgi:RHS repeat-associated protein
MQAEAFSYALGYNEKDYTSIGTASILATPIATTTDTKSKGLYNGNIASMTSKTPKMTEIPNQTAVLQQQYSYDQLNRITSSNTPGAGNKYRTGYSYDANGNIKTLARYDASSTRFDTLVYNYETKASGYLRTTNRLRWVDDDALLSGLQQTDVDDQSTDNYSYDAIGNLTKDNQEEIAKIEWTVSGKVRRVTRTAASTKPNLEFEYDASGNRIIKKVLKKNGEIISTYYLRDASGNVMSVYSYNANSDNDPALTEQYLYGSGRIGVYTPTANVLSKTRVIGRKSYELSDHLGNVRATLSDYRRLAAAATVNSATDYYPFGMVARAYNSSNQYRYGFNGKEHEDDITGGDYDFGARIYDPRLGRWLATDILFRNFAEISPYAFVLNSPIRAIDPDGKDVILIIWLAEGDDVGHIGIAVSNYVSEPYIELVDGVEVQKTRMVKDGTYTYYDNWPGVEVTFDLKGATTSVIAYRVPEQVTEEQFLDNLSTLSPKEESPPNGVLKLSTNYKQDLKVRKRLEKSNEKKAKYNGAWYNCSTYASDGLKGIFKKKVGRESMLGFITSITPNKLWTDTIKKAAKKNIETKVLKNPGQGVKKKFKDIIKAPAIE